MFTTKKSTTHSSRIEKFPSEQQYLNTVLESLKTKLSNKDNIDSAINHRESVTLPQNQNGHFLSFFENHSNYFFATNSSPLSVQCTIDHNRINALFKDFNTNAFPLAEKIILDAAIFSAQQRYWSQLEKTFSGINNEKYMKLISLKKQVEQTYDSLLKEILGHYPNGIFLPLPSSDWSLNPEFLKELDREINKTKGFLSRNKRRIAISTTLGAVGSGAGAAALTTTGAFAPFGIGVTGLSIAAGTGLALGGLLLAPAAIAAVYAYKQCTKNRRSYQNALQATNKDLSPNLRTHLLDSTPEIEYLSTANYDDPESDIVPTNKAFSANRSTFFRNQSPNDLPPEINEDQDESTNTNNGEFAITITPT